MIHLGRLDISVLAERLFIRVGVGSVMAGNSNRQSVEGSAERSAAEQAYMTVPERYRAFEWEAENSVAAEVVFYFYFRQKSLNRRRLKPVLQWPDRVGRWIRRVRDAKISSCY